MIRLRTEDIERRTLSPLAVRSSESRGRLRPEEPCPIRTCFQVDRDRIIHSKAFRRLKRKTQVLILPKGDHYRTRMTHTLEVMQISRTISRALLLNEDLTEAIALGHDLGHTPFGHAGEEVLNRLVDFTHAEQSLKVVDTIEKGGKGLNLTWEVKDGILKHSKGLGKILSNSPETLEGKVVRISDIIAYLNHDLDDALRADIIKSEDIPNFVRKTLGESYGERIDTMIKSVIKESGEDITIDEEVLEAMNTLRTFLYERVYMSKEVTRETVKVGRVVEELFHFYLDNPAEFLKDSGWKGEDLKQLIVDFIAGMTDNFALWLWEEKFVPKPFSKV